MIKHVQITYRGTPDLAVADKKSITEDALVGAIRMWHRRFLLRHFYVSAEKKYRYGKRTIGYLARKKRKQGHVQPLMFTGKMRSELFRRLDTRTFKFKRKGAARGTMYARVLNLYSKPTAPHEIKRELTEMTELEIKQIMRLVRRGVETRFKQAKVRQRRVIVL